MIPDQMAELAALLRDLAFALRPTTNPDARNDAADLYRAAAVIENIAQRVRAVEQAHGIRREK